MSIIEQVRAEIDAAEAELSGFELRAYSRGMSTEGLSAYMAERAVLANKRDALECEMRAMLRMPPSKRQRIAR